MQSRCIRYHQPLKKFASYLRRPAGGPKTIFGCILLGLALNAQSEPRELRWPDLIPPLQGTAQRDVLDMERQLRAMPSSERKRYDNVAVELTVRDEIAAGELNESDLSDREKRALASESVRKNPQVVKFWKRYDRLRLDYQKQSTQVHPGLNNVSVRMPGYVLPLEFDGDMVSEFLLVPYVGACIHSPAPPANQMVFVKSTKPFKSAGLYAPVWVEGILSGQSATRSLSLVDGSRNVDASYTLNALRVSAYTRQPK